MARGLVLGLVGLFLFAGRAAGQAQRELESAGNEARFRVIDRLSGGDDELVDDRSVSVDWRVSRRIRAALARRDWEAAASEVVSDGGMPEDSARGFVYAYVHQKQNKWESAHEAWEQLRGEIPELTDYVHYFGAKAALRADRPHRAVVLAAGVSRRSRLHPWSLEVLARGLLESSGSGDVERAGRVAKAHLEHFPEAPNRPAVRVVRARFFVEKGDFEAASAQLFDVLREAPLSDAAEDAEKLLEKYSAKLPAERREALDSPPPELQEARFAARFEAHRNEAIVEELPAVLEDWTPGSRRHCRGLYWVGKSYRKLRRHEEARKWYGEMLETCRGVSPFEKKALYLDGKSAWNAGELEEAVERFRTIWQEHSSHSFADDALYFAARIRREQDDPEAARELLQRQVETHPDGDMTPDAHWMLVQAYYDRGAYRKVVDYVDGLDGSVETERGTRGRLRYFAARAYDELGEKREAETRYRRLIDEEPFRPFALLAANQLARMQSDQRPLPPNLCDAPEVDWCDELVEAGADETETPEFELAGKVRQRPGFRTGLALLELGVREWAGREFRRLLGHLDRGDEAKWGVADLLHRAGEHEIAHRIPTNLGEWRAYYPRPETSRIWEIAYPRPYRQTVRHEVAERKIDEALVYAVMRKESAFDPGVRSWAGATGLMQLMEGTARDVARNIGLEDPTSSQLRRPSVNIELGVAYLDQLGAKFDNHPALVAAGYNAGSGQVGEWIDENGGFPLDRWLEAISYGQTRKYAKVTLGYWWVYRWMREGPAIPRLSFEVAQ